MKIQAALISLLAFTTLACSYAKGAPYIVEGERFPDNRLDAIEERMTMARLRELLGEPLEIAKEDETEGWRYYVWQRQDETIRYLGFIPARKPHYNGKKTATVFFRSSLVTEVSFRHEVMNRPPTSKLLRGNLITVADELDPAGDRTCAYEEGTYFLTQADGPWGSGLVISASVPLSAGWMRCGVTTH